MKLIDRVKGLKELLDLLANAPGIAAFVKVFFTDEAQQKMKKRIFEEERDELLEDIALLDPYLQEVWRRRLGEYEAVGKEDQLVWDVCKIKREVRQAWLLAWLARQTDQDFDQWVSLLRDNKLEQFLIRLREWFIPYLLKGWEKLPEFEDAVIWLIGARDRVDAMVRLREIRDRLQERAEAKGFWRRVGRWVS